MAASAPNASVRAALSSDPTVTSTRAPACRAIWMPAVPTPLAPAWMSTVSPASSRPSVNRVSLAVKKTSGTAAAFTKSQPSGMGMAMRWSMQAFSA